MHLADNQTEPSEHHAMLCLMYAFDSLGINIWGIESIGSLYKFAKALDVLPVFLLISGIEMLPFDSSCMKKKGLCRVRS